MLFRTHDAPPLARVGHSHAEKTLLKAIRCPQSCRGLLPALILIESAIAEYLKVSSLPRVARWLEVVCTLIERVEHLDEEGLGGLRTPDKSAPEMVYSRLCTQYAPRLQASCHERALALLGMLILDACAQDRPLVESVIAAWYTLMLGNSRAADWRTFSTTVPTSLPELNFALESARTSGLINLISGLVAALGRPIKDPEQDLTPSTECEESQGKHEITNGMTSSNERDDDAEDDPQAPSGKKNAKLRGQLDVTKASDSPDTPSQHEQSELVGRLTVANRVNAAYLTLSQSRCGGR